MLAQADALVLAGHLFSGAPAVDELTSLTYANVQWTARLAEKFVALGGRRIVVTGTSWESVGPDQRPANSYAATKSAAHTLLSTFCQEHAVALCWLRISDTFGIDDPRRKIFSLLREAIRDGARIAMSPGEQVFDPVEAADAARAIATASLNVTSGTWSIAGGMPDTLKHKIDRYCILTGKRSPVDWGERPYRWGEPFQINWAPPPPWWKPSHTFDEAVLRMERAPGGLLHQSQSP
jgi:nucleoside-diphosphate-sugar epimerase